MIQRKTLILLRNSTVALSVICLFMAAVFLFKFVTAEIEKKDSASVRSPVEVSHKVLFLSSYNPLYFTYESQVRGLNKSLYSQGIEYDVFYMDSASMKNLDLKKIYYFLKDRIQDSRRYEAVLLGDDNALKFALEYQNDLFLKTPMIYFGINNYELALEASKNPYMTGFYENDYLEETINLAIKLFPQKKTLVALHGQSAAGLSDIEIFWSFREKYKDYAFVDLDATLLSQNDLIYLLESLPKDSILFYMTCYSDKAGNVYSMLSRTGTVVRSAKVPIFRNYVGGEGNVGHRRADLLNQFKVAFARVAAVHSLQNFCGTVLHRQMYVLANFLFLRHHFYQAVGQVFWVA